MAKKVLVVDDEKLIVKGIRFSLEQDGMEVTCAYDGEEALLCAKEQKFDMILLDIMLPKLSGTEVCQLIREFSDVPIVMLTAKNDDMDKIMGLEYGADDYITKPFTLALVKMHIEAVLKRAGKLRTMVEYNDLQADVNAQLLFYKGQHIPTTRKEFDLMVYFMEHPGIVLPRDTILNAVWEYDYTGDVRTIDTLVKQLRKKMGEGCNYIRTVYGVGYIFGEDIHEN